MAKCSADEAQSKKSIQDFFDKLNRPGPKGPGRSVLRSVFQLTVTVASALVLATPVASVMTQR